MTEDGRAGRAMSHTPTELPDENARTAAWEGELVRRYETHLYMTASDRREARRIILKRAAISKAEGRS